MIRRTFAILILGFLLWAPLSAQVVKPAPGELVPWQSTFQAVAGDAWLWRASQVRAESGFNPRATSPVGARGGAQFMAATWKEQERKKRIPPGSDPCNPHAFIPAQHYYMLDLEAFARVRGMRTDRGIRDAGHGAYNAGSGSLQRAIWAAASIGLISRPGTEDAWLQALPLVTGKHAGETNGYLRNINGFHADYMRRL